MKGSADSFSGTATYAVDLDEEPWVLKFVFWRPFQRSEIASFTLRSFTSIVPNQSSLLLWVGVALN